MFRVVLQSQGASIAAPIMGASQGHLIAPVMSSSDAKVSIFENLLKNLTAAQVLRKSIWFSVSVPKIKIDPPPEGKNALVFIF